MEHGEARPEEVLAEIPWPCWIEVDLDALRHNVGALRKLVDPGCQVMAVVKAQAYGHGAVPVARAALEAGATWLAVARVQEGKQLRDAGIDAPTLLLGPFSDAEVPLMVQCELRPTITSLRQARTVSRVATSMGRGVRVHLKVDTGLGRYGAPLEGLLSLVRGMESLPGVLLEGLYSHFSTADDPDGSYAASQLQAFRSARETLEREGFRFPVVHMAASGATLAVDGSHLTMVRIGLSLYGLYPSPHMASRVLLRPALSLRSRVARVFPLQPGQSVGYGRTFIASEPLTAALIPVGYADGLPRSHSNQGFVLVNGRRVRLIGRISMDQCVADVTDCRTVAEGDQVVLIGSQGQAAISCEEFAERSGTISYEVLTSLGHRVPRVYRSQGAVVGIAHLDEGRYEERRENRE